MCLQDFSKTEANSWVHPWRPGDSVPTKNFRIFEHLPAEDEPVVGLSGSARLNFEFKGYQTVAPPSRFSFPKMPADIWLKLTASTDGPVQVDIQRYDGMKAYVAKTQTWTIAPANLTGAVYYWEVNNGKVVRLTIGDVGPQQFVQSNRCTACHSVSKDGSRIAAAFDGGWSPWTTIDSATGAVLYSAETASGFQAISPNGSHTLWGQSDGVGTLKLSAYNNKNPVAQLSTPGGAALIGRFAGGSRAIRRPPDFSLPLRLCPSAARPVRSSHSCRSAWIGSSWAACRAGM